MPDETIRLIGIVTFLALCAGGVALWTHRSRREDARLEQERAEKIRQSFEAGETDEHGNPKCVVCGARATCYTVRTGQHWSADIWFVRTLNRLWALPWRYTIVDDEELGPRLCSAHRRSAEAKLDHVHNGWRSRHASLNAAIHEESSVLDQGGLEASLIEEHNRIKSVFRPRPPSDSQASLDANEEIPLLPLNVSGDNE